MRNQVRWTTAIILAPSHLVQGDKSIPVRCKGAAASFCFEHELSHLLEVVDEHHVEGLIPATVEEEVEAIHLQEMAMWALIASPWNKSSVYHNSQIKGTKNPLSKDSTLKRDAEASVTLNQNEY